MVNKINTRTTDYKENNNRDSFLQFEDIIIFLASMLSL